MAAAAHPTTKLAIKLPAGVTAKKPVGPKGFVGSVAGNVITFDRGTLAPTVHGAFTAVLTFPKTKGLLAFPAVQTCVKGSTSWIELPWQAAPSPLTRRRRSVWARRAPSQTDGPPQPERPATASWW